MKAGPFFAALLAMGIATAPLRADRWGDVVYSNNKGASLDDAIVITGAKDDFESTRAEYGYLAHHFPRYKMGMQALLDNKGRAYDPLQFTDASGTSHKIYFDITEAMRKLDAEMKTSPKATPH